MNSFKWSKLKAAFWAILEAVITPRLRFNQKLMDRSRTFFTRRIVRSFGVERIEVKGELHPDTELIAANHQTMADIFVLEDIMGNDIRFIGRKGIMDKWPTSAIVDLVGHITIDQKDRRAIIHLLSEVKQKRGRHQVVIFPEGTRRQTGRVESFEGGTKVLAEKLSLKVQPCVIKNIINIYDEFNKKAKKGVVEVTFLSPVTLCEGWYEKMHDDMQNAFSA